MGQATAVAIAVFRSVRWWNSALESCCRSGCCGVWVCDILRCCERDRLEDLKLSPASLLIRLEKSEMFKKSERWKLYMQMIDCSFMASTRSPRRRDFSSISSPWTNELILINGQF